MSQFKVSDDDSSSPSNKFKVGDRIMVLNFQEGKTGVIVVDYNGIRTKDFIWVAQLDNGEIWNYRDEDIRLLTPLEQLL